MIYLVLGSLSVCLRPQQKSASVTRQKSVYKVCQFRPKKFTKADIVLYYSTTAKLCYATGWVLSLRTIGCHESLEKGSPGKQKYDPRSQLQRSAPLLVMLNACITPFNLSNFNEMIARDANLHHYSCTKLQALKGKLISI